EVGHGVEELLDVRVCAEPHHALDARAIVPTAIEQHEFADRRQMGDVALKIPLRALALARYGERDDAAHPRIQALRDAFDDAAFSGRIASLEQHHHFEFLLNDPVLELDELALQAKKLPEIKAAIERLRSCAGERSAACERIGRMHVADELGEALVVDFHFELLVEGLEDLASDAFFVHGRQTYHRFRWF